MPPVFAAFAVVLLSAGILYVRYPGNFPSYQHGTPGDFGAYIQAYDRIQEGQNPYISTDPGTYRYAPGVLALIEFLPKSPVDAWFMFTCICIAALALALTIGARYRTWGDVGRLFVGLCLAWKGIIESLDQGSNEMLILSLATFAASIFTRFPFISGVLVGFLPWLKLPWVFLILPFVLAGRPGRRSRIFISGVVLSLFFWAAMVPSLAFGPENAIKLSQAWVDVLRNQGHEFFLRDLNQSIWGLFARLYGEKIGYAVGLPFIIVGFLLGLLIRRKPQTIPTQDTLSWLTPWMLFTQILNPLSWRWGSVYLAGSLFATQKGSLGSKWVRVLLGIGLFALWALQLNPVVQSIGIHQWTELHTYGIVTGYWFLILVLAL